MVVVVVVYSIRGSAANSMFPRPPKVVLSTPCFQVAPNSQCYVVNSVLSSRPKFTMLCCQLRAFKSPQIHSVMLPTPCFQVAQVHCVVLPTAGEERPVVGRVSMDAITVTVRPSTTVDTPFYIYSDDLTLANSVAGVAKALGTIPYEVGTRLAIRLPRLYVTANCVFTADGKVTTTTGTLSQCKWDGQGTSNSAGSERTS